MYVSVFCATKKQYQTKPAALFSLSSSEQTEDVTKGESRE